MGVPRLWWVLCVVAGLAMLAMIVMMGMVPGQLACDGDPSLGAVLRLELVRSPADIDALFGNAPCRAVLADAMDAVNRIDVLAFIPAFTLFQIFAALAMRGRGRALAYAIVAAAVVAGVCDLLEDQILFSITREVRDIEHWYTVPFGMLAAFVHAKFALLAVAAVLLGLLVRRGSGSIARFGGPAMIAGGLSSLAGAIWPALLAPGLTVAWGIVLLVAIIRSARSTRIEAPA